MWDVLKHGVVTPNIFSWKPSRMLQECVGTVGVKRDCTNVRAVSVLYRAPRDSFPRGHHNKT